MKPTMGSLFAGIGGFDLGFERAGFKTVWQVEIDPYCQKVLAKNFPEAERFGDIRECGSHNLKPVDVICGGFPCQDISLAGNRGGIEGETRSGLWRDMQRIICELRPRFVVVENVSALLIPVRDDDGRIFESAPIGRVLGDLASAGYDAQWRSVWASRFGAMQRRERVFIVAYDASQYGPSGSAYLEEGAISRESGRGIGRQVPGTYWDEVECPGWGVAHGLPDRLDRLHGLGNAVVPQIPEMIARRIKQQLALSALGERDGAK